jgi:CubicO group peptidase (beta-lactamase class C family)
MAHTRRKVPRRVAVIALVLAAATGLTACAAPAAAPLPARPAHSEPAHGALTRDDVDAWLDGVVGSALESTGIPGATVSVVADGHLLTERGYGRADTGTGDTPARDVDPDSTLFRIGSVSKVVTATAVMQLVEQGRLDLDTDVQEYLDFDLPTPEGAVTLRHLLTHTAGFEERVSGLFAAPGSHPVLRDVVSVDPPAQVFAPGTTPSYSNYGNTLAGYIVEHVSGEPYDEYLQRHVFDVAGMDSTSSAQPLPAELDARLAHGYADDSQPAIPTEVVGTAPAGSVSSTATDMATFMLAHLDALPAERRLLKPETLAEMHSPGLDADQLGSFAEGRRMDLGFFDDSTPGLSAFGHDGDTQVFHTAMRMFPDHRAGIFVSLNGNGRDALDAYDLRDAVLDGFGDRYLRGTEAAAGTGTTSAAPEDSEPLATDRASSTKAALALAGTYGSSRIPFRNPGALLGLSGQTTIAAQSDGTVAITPRPAGTGTAIYENIGPDLWREVGRNGLLATRTENGEVRAATWGASFTLLRLDAAHDAGIALPVLIASVLVLLVSLLAWPVGALRRRRLATAASATHASDASAVSRPSSVSVTSARVSTAHRVLSPRLPGVLSRVGTVAVLLAILGWVVVAMSALSYQDVPAAVLRVVQALQLVGVLAVLPATAAVVQSVRLARGPMGVITVVGRLLVLLALAGVAWFAIAQPLLSLDVSY